MYGSFFPAHRQSYGFDVLFLIFARKVGKRLNKWTFHATNHFVRWCAPTSRRRRELVDEGAGVCRERLAGVCRYDGSPMLHLTPSMWRRHTRRSIWAATPPSSATLHDVVRLAPQAAARRRSSRLTEEIRARFAKQVVGITMGLANISELRLKVAKEQADNFRDLIVLPRRPARVILIKLVRYHIKSRTNVDFLDLDEDAQTARPLRRVSTTSSPSASSSTARPRRRNSSAGRPTPW